MLLRGNWNADAVYLSATNNSLDSAYAIYLPSVCGQRDLYLASTNDVLAVYVALALSGALRIDAAGLLAGDNHMAAQAKAVVEAVVQRLQGESVVLPIETEMQVDVAVGLSGSTATDSQASMRVWVQTHASREAKNQGLCALSVSGGLTGKRVKLRELGEVADMQLSDVASWPLNQFYYVEV